MDLAAKASKAQALAGGAAQAIDLSDKTAFYQAVRAGLVKYTASGKKLTRTEREAAMRQILAKGVLVEGVTDLYDTLGVDKPDISLLNDEITSRARKNTTQAAKFSDKLGEAITKYRNRGLTTAEVIEELIRLAKESLIES